MKNNGSYYKYLRQPCPCQQFRLANIYQLSNRLLFLSGLDINPYKLHHFLYLIVLMNLSLKKGKRFKTLS